MKELFMENKQLDLQIMELGKVSVLTLGYGWIYNEDMFRMTDKVPFSQDR